MTPGPPVPPRILSIAGSDSSGGAGIQADIKTITMLGGYAMTAITAVTAQNTVGVQGITPLDGQFVATQITSCIDDIGVDAIKIGMLQNADIISHVADNLKAIAGNLPIILDPVMVATSGARLLEDEAVEVMRTRLFPLAAMLTPNLPELELLAGRELRDTDLARAAAQQMLAEQTSAPFLTGAPNVGDEHRPSPGRDHATAERNFHASDMHLLDLLAEPTHHKVHSGGSAIGGHGAVPIQWTYSNFSV